MAALIFQHRNAPVRFDPPVTPESIERAKEEAHRERAAVVAEMAHRYAMPSDDEMDRLTTQNLISDAIRQYGGERVARWVKNLAFIIEGQEPTDRPLDRCLADGTVLPASRICVRCGRDNN